MDDEKIVELFWQRNEEAIKETSKKYEAYLSKISYNILSDIEDTKECVNDTYNAAWNSMPDKKPAVLSTYLGKMVRQISIDVFRKKNSKKRYASEYAISLSEMGDTFADNQTPDSVFDTNELDKAMNDFIRALPDDVRRVFIGRYYFFDSVKKIAAYCGISESNAKSILFRTRKKLKEYLEKEGFSL